jgi:spermidine synthase
LLLIGLVIAPWRVPRSERVMPTLVLCFLLLATPFLYATKALPGPCQTETSYFCIRTEQVKASDGRSATGLFLDRLMHGSVILDDPTFLGYDYEVAYRALTDDQLARDPSLNLLVIGAGGYVFPRYMAAQHPQATVEVLEIDPGVIHFNQQHLGLPVDSPIISHAGDARLFLNGANGPAPRNKYKVVHEDAINDVSVPYHLTTLEFHHLVKQSMTPDGLYLVNLIDSGLQGQFVQAYVNTVRKVFANVTIYVLDGYLGRPGHATFVIAASDAPLSNLAIPSWTAYAPDNFLNQFATRVALILTDDHAPVDTLLQPALNDR